MITVTGATGNIGSRLAEILLGEGQKVRVVGRSEERLGKFTGQGAEAVVGNVEDAEFVSRAFKGSDAVFLLIPPNYGTADMRKYYNHIADNYVAAIKNNDIKNVVTLSSFGAHIPEKTGPIAGLFDLEAKVNMIPWLNVMHLRPSYFMENLFSFLGLIKENGITGSAIRPEIGIPMIATRDIATVAAEYLINLDFKGYNVRELLGERDLNMNEVTQVLGKAIGKPDLSYIQFSYEDSLGALVGMGFSQGAANSFIEMIKAFNEGLGIAPKTRTKENTTPTSIEEFASFFAQAYNA
jgi:uncharacterized protein YbjT (DUF2867 family)